jgi:hypothetical protein
MHPEHYEFLARDRYAEKRRDAAGDQLLARAARDGHTATSGLARRGWTWRVSRPRFAKLGRLIARHGEG